MDMMNSDAREQPAADQNGPEGPAAPKKKGFKRLKVKRFITQSTIGFPYRDLDVGVSVALAILGAGGVALTTDQLAGVMGLQAGSGNFVIKVMTARSFGLVTYGGGKYALTDIGAAIVDKDDKRQRDARARAFLNVPLYKRTYEEFRGRQLPPPHGLEQAFARFGVSSKQTRAARLAFEKSAMQAGYFAAGTDRLIEPIIGAPPPPPPPPSPPPLVASAGVFGGGPSRDTEVSGFHPFIQGLLDRLPEPDTTWTIEGRAKWLMAAANCFDLLYKGNGEINVTFKAAPDKE
jgi:hypothetical protein